MNETNIFLLTGVISGLYTIFAFYKYLTNDTTANELLLSISKANQLIQNKHFNFIIDVRTKKEWNKGHYKNAFHIPLDTLDKSKMHALTNKKLKVHILIYCRTGRRAKLATDIIKSFGYTNVNYIKQDHTKLII